ncbi:hypothetical protein HJC23_006165 [Cyclotella cryptica]|uniref:Peptidase M16 C-terminal domain-containing protein n=1 Tax=Cyclotella cryptica TaxID=29204 RepID=A0ABD3Q0U7_9STRA|eukprot:CCRYP_009779-RB/>CCRYP_009779-RB protein AED:0.13 eAED:0.13 QI:337/1/1/1/1/1/4/189/427
MMLQTALKSSRRTMSTVAASIAASGEIPAYVLHAPKEVVSTTANGIQVCSLMGDSNTPQYITVRISNLGSRHDKVGGESALLASSLAGGQSGREHLSLSSLSSLTLPTAESLEQLKAAQIAKLDSNSYESQMLDHLHGTAFQGNALGNPLEGTAESVAGVSVEDLAALLAEVRGENVVVVGTGGGSHEKLVEEVEKVMGGLSSGGSTKEVGKVAEKAYFMGSDIRIRYDSHKNATIALGYQGASWTDPKTMPLALMTTLLGSYTSSSGIGKNIAATMCQEVAEIASSISAFNLSYSDTGLFGVVATAPDNMLDDLMWNVMPNLVRLAHGVSEEEMARAKLALKAQILSSMDGEIAAGEEMARQIQTIGRVMPLAEAMARVDALTMDDVKAAANEVINDQDHALAAIGGIHELPDYNWIRRKSYMLRY